MLLLSLVLITFFILYIYMTNNIVFKMKTFSDINLNKHSKDIEKVIVFDMDETLGHFVQLGSLNNIIESYFNRKINENDFNRMIDLYPEILRPNIIEILNFLKIMKKSSKCLKVLIYTNNQGPKEWAIKIAKYFNYKLGYKLFDQVIGSKMNESKRTTNEKTFNDLKRCANLANNVRVCFIDDLYHRHMDKQHIQYIMIQPYIRSLPNNVIIERLCNSNIFNINNRYNFTNYINKNMGNFGSNKFDYKNVKFLQQNIVTFF